MPSFEITLVLLAVAVVLLQVARRSRVPYPAMLALVGGCVAALSFAARQHGDVVVWGGPARLHHHGVPAPKDGHHDVLGSQRLNLTFRRAG